MLLCIVRRLTESNAAVDQKVATRCNIFDPSPDQIAAESTRHALPAAAASLQSASPWAVRFGAGRIGFSFAWSSSLVAEDGE